jgi:hypothetical protein
MHFVTVHVFGLMNVWGSEGCLDGPVHVTAFKHGWSCDHMAVCDQQLIVHCATEWAWQNKWEHCDMMKCEHSTWQRPSKQDQCAVLHFFMLKMVECWKVWASSIGPGSYTMWLACVCSPQEYSRSYECVEYAVILAAFCGDLGIGFPWLVCQWDVWFQAYGASV